MTDSSRERYRENIANLQEQRREKAELKVKRLGPGQFPGYRDWHVAYDVTFENGRIYRAFIPLAVPPLTAEQMARDEAWTALVSQAASESKL